MSEPWEDEPLTKGELYRILKKLASYRFGAHLRLLNDFMRELKKGP